MMPRKSARELQRPHKQSLSMQNRCAEIKIRAERRAGEILRGMERQPASRPSEKALQDERLSDDLPRLKDLGINYAQSHRWQSVASLPEDQFEEYIAQAKDSEVELTSKGIQTFAKTLKKKNELETFEQDHSARETLQCHQFRDRLLDLDMMSSFPLLFLGNLTLALSQD